MKALALFLLLCAPASAQLSYGLIGGAPFGNLTSFSSRDRSGAYTIGPTVQLGLPLGFRVEADALYRPVGYSTASGNLSAAQWRFPLLVQYRLSAPVVKPFVEAGYSYDHVNLRDQIASHHGFVIGAGLDFKIPFVRVSPGIRFTRDLDAGNGNALRLNQAEFLVAVRF